MGVLTFPINVDAAVAGRAGVFAWLKNAGIVKLNLVLVLSLISSYTTGFDSSMMNGLQSLDTWKDYFGYPDASDLALCVLNLSWQSFKIVLLTASQIECNSECRSTSFPAFLRLGLRLFRSPGGTLNWGFHLDYRSRPAGRRPEYGHVHRCTWYSWFRAGIEHHSCPSPRHGVGLPLAASPDGQHLQRPLELRCSHRSLGDLRHLSSRVRLGLEDPVITPGAVKCASACAVLLD